VLLLATFLTVHFGEWRESWHGTNGLARSGESAFHAIRRENEGVLAALDPQTGEFLWTLTLDTPTGFALTDDYIYVNSMYGNRITILTPDCVALDVMARWFMNDLHSLAVTDRGLIMTCSGLDGIVEVDLSGQVVWDWFAIERGYASHLRRSQRRVRRDRDYRRSMIPTQQQVTHCNSAVVGEHQGSDAVIATLFHQGEVIVIDRKMGRATVVLSGMANPHSLRRTETGWLVCDSRSNSIIRTDENFWIAASYEGDFDWVQDAIIHEDRLLVADANHSRMVWLDAGHGQMVGEIRYSEQWKIYQVEAVGGLWEKRLRKVEIPSSRGRGEIRNGGSETA
jgi:hypothetical protein